MAATGIIPTVDFVFKRLFGTPENADLLIHFLNGVTQFPEGRRVVSVEFINPARNRQTGDEKLTVVDILVQDERGRSIIVEMQMIVGSGFRERVLYYWACEYADQIEEGDPYELLQPTIVVCVSQNAMVGGSEKHHHRFLIRSDDQTILFTDRLEIHTIELCKFQNPADRLDNDLDRWSDFLKHGEELDPAALPSTLNAPPLSRAVKVLDVISQNKLDRKQYRAQLKRQRDLESHDRFMHKRGREEGHEEGREQGRLIGAIAAFELVLGEGPTPEVELLAMTVEQLKQRADALRARIPDSPR